jgi:hypothetical protein
VREERLELGKDSGVKSAIQEQALKQHELSPSAPDELVPLNDEKKQSELAQMVHLKKTRSHPKTVYKKTRSYSQSDRYND